MGVGQLAMFGAQFVAALLAAFVWLLICKTIPGLRRRPAFSYTIGAILVLITCLVLPAGLTAAGMGAGVIMLAILYVLYRRALRKHSFEAATIISYENNNIF